jgi:hypothetical protein
MKSEALLSSGKRIVICVGSILLITGIVSIWYLTLPVVYIQEIRSTDSNAKIYLKCVGYGVTGDHRIVTISNEKAGGSRINRRRDYFLLGFEDVYYKFTNDSLLVYSSGQFSCPSDFSPKIKVTIRQNMSLRELEKEKAKLGLIQWSPYPRIQESGLFWRM